MAYKKRYEKTHSNHDFAEMGNPQVLHVALVLGLFQGIARLYLLFALLFIFLFKKIICFTRWLPTGYKGEGYGKNYGGGKGKRQQ